MFGRCDYVEFDWWCEEPEGHDGEHRYKVFAAAETPQAPRQEGEEG